jgi:SET domain
MYFLNSRYISLSSLFLSRSICRLASTRSSKPVLPSGAHIHDATGSMTGWHPIPLLDILYRNSDVRIWSNRRVLQDQFSLRDKGWHVDVVWNMTPQYGIAVYANQDIARGTVVRTGYLHKNLIPLASVEAIESFCGGPWNSDQTSPLYQQRLQYVQDYLWGYYPTSSTDERGYPRETEHGAMDARFFGMWIPGNGLNHNNNANTVYRDLPGGPFQQGLQLVALTDIAKGEELFDDYRRHGTAPLWLRRFAQDKNITLNFADCNGFVS